MVILSCTYLQITKRKALPRERERNRRKMGRNLIITLARNDAVYSCILFVLWAVLDNRLMECGQLVMKPYFRFLAEDRSPTIGTTRKNNKADVLQHVTSSIARPGQPEERHFEERRNHLFELVGTQQSNSSGRCLSTYNCHFPYSETKKFCSLSQVCQDLAYSSY